MKKRIKKAFTLVELLVVIAILAVLSTVAVVGYNSFTEKAKVSNDKGLVTQLNKLLQADEVTDGKAKTPSDALEVVVKDGFDVKKIVATADDYDIVWNEESNRFVLLDDNKVAVVEELSEDAYKNWKFSNDVSSVKTNGFSIYLNDKFAGTEVTVSSGLDVGNNEGVNVKYITGDSEQVIIKTNGGALNINAANATVNHYGSSDSVYVEDVADSTYNLFGEAKFIKVADGEHVVLKSGSKANAIFVDGINKNVEAQNGQSGNVYTTADGISEEVIKTSGILFAGGLGTEASPYLIENVEQLANINEMFNKGFYSYKVADGVETLDLSEANSFELNGSFDGNGVAFTNVSSFVFRQVGIGDERNEETFKLCNFKVKFVGGAGIVKNNCAKNLEFNNIDASGYLICGSNAGIFLRYGPGNATSGVGFSYSVSFKNCSTNAEVYSSNSSYSAILIGHPFPGSGNTATINVDSSTNNNINDAILYYTGTAEEAFGNKYYCTTATVKLNVDGVDNPNNMVTGVNVVKVDSTKNPSKNENGSYDIMVESDTAKIVVSLSWMYTAYTDNYENIILGNIGGILRDSIVFEVSDEKELVLFESIESIEIVTGSDTFSYEIKNGKFTIYINQDFECVDGTLSLVVEQFTSSSNIAKYKGNLTVAVNDKGVWTIY